MTPVQAATLAPCDILLWRVTKSANWLDRAIAWAQHKIHEAPSGSDYCHVAVMAETPLYFYEARWPKIRRTFLDIGKIQRGLVLEAYRLKSFPAPQSQQIQAYAKSRVGEHYDGLALLTMGKFHIGDADVCSEFVFKSFTHGGILLCPEDKLVSPDDIAASTMLNKLF